jgi:hypothetical protein
MFPPFVHAAPRRVLSFQLMVTLHTALLLSLAILLVRAQGSRDSSLHILLKPSSDCPAPCFLGITLGVTPLNVGLTKLRANPLIQSLSPVSPGVYHIEFAPVFTPLRAMQMQVLTESQSEVIEAIYVSNSGLQLSDISLSLGAPESLILDEGLDFGLVTYVGFYPQHQLYVKVILPVCLVDEKLFWQARYNVLIGIVSAQQYVEEHSSYPLEANRNGKGWLQQLHRIKRSSCSVQTEIIKTV